MSQKPDVDKVAGALQVSIGLLVRRLRQVRVDGDLTLTENSALARLDRGGPMTATALARIEQVTPQSMGATVAALESRRLVDRTPDPDDGRRVVISVTAAGLELLRRGRSAKSERMARVLDAEFTATELQRLMAAAPLIERLAEHI
jgi:DNA-binding MarR family transcriptional regulator